MPDIPRNNDERKYAPNTINRRDFVDSVARMAGEVWDFHNRFEVG